MKTLFATILLLISTVTWAGNSCLEIDIMLCADFSGSVQGHEEYVANAMWAFVDRFDLSEASVKIGIVIFNEGATLLSPLTTDKKKLQNIILAISNSRAQYGTAMDAGLMTAGEELLYGRKVTKMLVLITDGAPDYQNKATEASKLVQLSGVNICGVYVGTDVGDLAYLKTICKENCVSETSFSGLADELKKLDVCL